MGLNPDKDRPPQGASGAITDTVGRVGSVARECPLALRAVAFTWILVNVYIVAVHPEFVLKHPVAFGPAFAVLVLSTWAALDGKRWGWFGMVLLAASSLVDLCVGLLITLGRAWSNSATQADLSACLRQGMNWLHMGPGFGTLLVGIWLVSLMALLAPSVRRPIFASKQKRLTPVQALIGVALMVFYLTGVAIVGVTANALRSQPPDVSVADTDWQLRR
jgi:hypothetical protein